VRSNRSAPPVQVEQLNKIDAAGRHLLALISVIPDLLNIDAGRLALFNFAGNAVKFTERGSIAICARVFAADNRDLPVRFDVADTGNAAPPVRRVWTGRFINDTPLWRHRAGLGDHAAPRPVDGR
jgi:signal transduction histidine kinase